MGGVYGDTVSAVGVKCDTSPQVADGGVVFCVLPSPPHTPHHHSNSVLIFYTNIATHFEEMKNTLTHNCIGSHSNCLNLILLTIFSDYIAWCPSAG